MMALLPAKPQLRPLHALRILAGFALLIVGGVLSLPGVPGPGIAIILLGLWILSDHFTWAKRAIAWVKERTAWFRRGKTEGQTVPDRNGR